MSSKTFSDDAAFSQAEEAAFSYEVNVEKRVSEASKKESTRLSSKEDLAWDGKKRDHTRTQKFKDFASIGMRLIFIIMVFWISIGICIYCWHLFAPAKFQYLCQAQLDKMQSIFTGSVISAFIIKYIQNRSD